MVENQFQLCFDLETLWVKHHYNILRRLFQGRFKLKIKI